jgi:integrase/recombinase XerD
MTHPMFDPERRCLPVEEWPTLDRAAWALALAPYDPLEPEAGLATSWARGTRSGVQNGYGRWLGWLQRSGDLDADASPANRVTHDRVRAYLGKLKDMDYAPYTISGRLQQLGDAMRVMVPDGDWGWIRRGAARLHSQARPVKDLNHRMRPPEEVLKLGLDLMHHAEHDRFRSKYDRAVMYRDGLALAALIHRPLRIGNYASIAFGRQLRRFGEGWRLSFSAAEMKARRPFECAWPDELVAALDRYIDVHRKVLFEGKRDPASACALWIAQGGAGMTSQVLAHRIIKRTEDEFGTAINPHTFRHIAATTIATDDPENITAVPSVLAHATIETSERFYNRAKQIDAADRYQGIVTERRRRGPRGAKAREVGPLFV